MSPRLLVMLDVLRHILQSPIFISKNDQALGRRSGLSESEHNVEFWNQVLAVDCFVKDVHTYAQALRVVESARIVGFTGIGVYPQWTNNVGRRQVGFHFGVRPSRKMDNPATWGYYDGKFVSLDYALSQVTKED